jgi:peptidyl-prolyl cis-trans isomerase A (cyclophilin A)
MRLSWILLAVALVLAPAACRKPTPAELLLRPGKLTETAPPVFSVQFATTKGDFVVEVHRAWAPRGADRFYNLVRAGFFDGAKFFRALSGFMVQVGISGDPKVSRAWQSAEIADDPVQESNARGQLTFAMAGPGTRTTQIFINLVDNRALDLRGFAPFAKVVSGMEVVDRLYTGYGEAAPEGRGPVQARIQSEGNAYLEKEFPLLDAVKTARLLP